MRHVPLLFFGLLGAASLLSGAFAAPAFAQVNDAERAAARDLFRQGDELQREARFDEALLKFQHAEQLYSAPTNQLRVAECEAALGRLVESAEAYREVLRTTLPRGAPPAFQAAVDQARTELEQVEPRVPKLTIVVQPGNVGKPTLEVDGQSVPAALIGEAVPLDPGPHRVAISAPGYPRVEQVIVLKEAEARITLLALKPAPALAAAAGTAGTVGVSPDESATPPSSSASPMRPMASAPEPPAPAPFTATEPPPPPPAVLDRPNAGRRVSWKGVLLGGHLGGEWINGTLPLSNGGSIDATQLVSGGVAYGLDVGLRFARRWYVGLSLDHANYTTRSVGVFTTTTANSTLVGAVIGAMVNPDRPSFYGEAGIAARWFTVRGSDDGTFSGPEFELGLGLWLPVARAMRLLPKATLTLGDLSGNPPPPSMPGHGEGSKSPTGQAIFSLVLTGFYNIDL
jgi:hypothetical protein